MSMALDTSDKQAEISYFLTHHSGRLPIPLSFFSQDTSSSAPPRLVAMSSKRDGDERPL
jgi:hypothetical protein